MNVSSHVEPIHADGQRIAGLLDRLLDDGDLLDTADRLGLPADPNRLRLSPRAPRVGVRRDCPRAFYRPGDAHVPMLLDVALTHTRHEQVHPDRG